MARVALLDESVGDRMAGVAGPDARRAFMHRPAMADAIGRFNEAVADSQLPLRLHEVVRYRIAQINGCARCQAYRTPGADEAGADEATLERVEGWRDDDTFDTFDEVERLALDYAERFSLTPQAIDDELVAALRRELGDAQLVDLSICIAKYVAMGRLITALDLDQTCVIVRSGSVASTAS
jgi:AhpD family alkylhydroperoxidase